MIINGNVIKDSFLFATVKSIAEEHNVKDEKVLLKVYNEMSSKIWSCKMIEDSILKHKE